MKVPQFEHRERNLKIQKFSDSKIKRIITREYWSIPLESEKVKVRTLVFGISVIFVYRFRRTFDMSIRSIGTHHPATCYSDLLLRPNLTANTIDRGSYGGTSSSRRSYD